MDISRRGFLGSLGLAAAGRFAWLQPSPQRLRVAFITDLHLTARGTALRAARLYKRVREERPDLVLYGGDNVMAVDYRNPRQDADDQFASFVHLRDLHVKVPTLAVIGNHDIWWNNEDPALEKGLAMKAFKMPSPYYRESAGGWTFLMLDSFHKDGCWVKGEQLEWLRKELKDGTGPLVITSHAPILSATHFHELGAAKDGGWKVPGSWQVGNSPELMDIFRESGRKILCLSGHMHHVDYVEYHGVSYLCGGAASGAWWGGSYHHFPAAYVVLDIQPDGSFTRRTVFWESEAEGQGGA